MDYSRSQPATTLRIQHGAPCGSLDQNTAVAGEPTDGEGPMKTVQSMLAEADAEVPRITPDEAKGLLGRADVLFLDVREPAEVTASGKIPGAVAIPRGLVEFRADPASAMHDAVFDRTKTVIAYCASGGRSALVGKTLKDMGYGNVRNLGGFKGWLDAGGDVEKG
ncbi:rhodanese-like domain-containing protein [Bradyrhizobium australiense]